MFMEEMVEAQIAKISGSFLGRMLFKFALMLMLFASSVILINNFVLGYYNGTANKDIAVSFGSIGLIVSVISIFIIVAVDINGWHGLESFGIVQGSEFCINETGFVAFSAPKASGSGSGSRGNGGGGISRSAMDEGVQGSDSQAMYNAPRVAGS
jgi:hypothetical protein